MQYTEQYYIITVAYVSGIYGNICITGKGYRYF